MKASQILSRRAGAVVDFRPDADPKSPYGQLRRLASLLAGSELKADDIDDSLLDWHLEYVYRKIFTGTTHEDYLATDPEVVEWLVAVHEIEAEAFRSKK